VLEVIALEFDHCPPSHQTRRRSIMTLTSGISGKFATESRSLGGAEYSPAGVYDASTTFDEPYHVARRFASLDHISDGRAGWSVVATVNPDPALDFGVAYNDEHDERYRPALEFHAVVTGL